MDLRTALRNIHADPRWWRKTLIGGALVMSVIGSPLAGGWVVESMENSRKGYPTPLPPWGDWSSRYLIGIFALVIDFLFYALPFLVGALLFFCVALASVIRGDRELAVGFLRLAAGVLAVLVTLAFLSGVAPVGRLMYLQDGTPEDAMSARALREALRPGARIVYARARLASLPAYIPVTLLSAAFWLAASTLTITGTWLISLLLLWLACSAWVYAHLATAQIYAATEHELLRRGLSRIEGDLR